MKRILITASLLLTLSTPAYAYTYNEPHSTELQAQLESAKKNTVSISAYQYGEKYAKWGKSGSGAILKDGYILTAYHVIEEANDINLTTYDGKRYDAEVIKTDPSHDLAVLRTTAPLEGFTISSEELYAGDALLTVGQPSGLPEWSYSEGEVIDPAKPCRLDNYQFEMVQSSNEVKKGNSGGPMVNDDGELVGILVGNVVQTGDALSVRLADVKTFLSDVGMGYMDVDVTYEGEE